MSQKRSLTGFLVASLGLAAGLAAFSAPASAAAECSADSKGIAEIAAVCEKGGKDAVKKAMKSAVDEATKAKVMIGDKPIGCKSCHTDTSDYKVSSNAKADFKAHLAQYFK